MKFYINFFIKTLTIATLFCLQLCFICYQQTPAIHPLLLAYTYTLCTNPSIIMLTALMILLDALTFMRTNIVGLTIIFLAPLSWFLLKTRKDVYNKALAPCILITSYQIFYEFSLWKFLQYPLHPFAMAWTTFANCFLFVLLWHATNQLFHD